MKLEHDIFLAENVDKHKFSKLLPPCGLLGLQCPAKPQIWAFNASLAVITLPWNSSVHQHSQSWLLVLSKRLQFCLSDCEVILVGRLKTRPLSQWEIWEFKLIFLVWVLRKVQAMMNLFSTHLQSHKLRSADTGVGWMLEWTSSANEPVGLNSRRVH